MTNTTPAAKKPSRSAALAPRAFASFIGWAFKPNATDREIASSLAMRLDALNMLEKCGRCGGGGRFSYNQIHGDMCYGCSGRGDKLPKLTTKLAETVKARVDAGEMAPYFAKQAQLQASKRTMKPLAAEIKATLQPLWDAYTAASRDNRGHSADTEIEAVHAFVQSPLFHVCHMANVLYYGPHKRSSVISQMSVSDLEMGVRFGDISDPLAVEAQMRWLLEQAKVVRAAFEAGAPDRPAGFVSAF